MGISNHWFILCKSISLSGSVQIWHIKPICSSIVQFFISKWQTSTRDFFFPIFHCPTNHNYLFESALWFMDTVKGITQNFSYKTSLVPAYSFLARLRWLGFKRKKRVELINFMSSSHVGCEFGMCPCSKLCALNVGFLGLPKIHQNIVLTEWDFLSQHGLCLTFS